MKKELVIALVGNPNCGKTSLFNALTGAKQHVGNWPGVTVEKKEGRLTFEGRNITVVDLPGTYSLGAYSEDEVVARNFILEGSPDVVINVVDSTNIERNLYLTTQLMEMNTNVVLALNMMDEAKNKNIDIDEFKLSEKLGIHTVPTIAIKKEGVKDLLKKTIQLGENKKQLSFKMDYGKEIEKEITNLKNIIIDSPVSLGYPAEWTALKLLENDAYIVNKINENGLNKRLMDEVKTSISTLTKSIGYEPEAYIVDMRYDFIAEATKNSVKKPSGKILSTSDKIDKVITHKIWGIPIFATIMFLMYQITITFGNDFLGGFIDEGFAFLGEWASEAMVNSPELLQSFVVDAVIGGMGAVIVFVPLLFTMYFLISLLEDSGYMARAAYVMDRFMSSIGLHGKTAVSLIISSGCNVAGIMSTRTMESKKDRMVSILINPFISCGARLPVYALFVSAFFEEKKIGIFSQAGIIIFGLYVLGIIMAIFMGKIFSSTLFKGEQSYFVMELPPYRIPTIKGVIIHMWEKSEAFIKKAGTIIFGIVVLVWALSNLPAGVEPGSENSILGIIGSAIAPIFKPAGFGNWQSGVALITGLGAKEAVVGTMATVYGVASEGVELIQEVRQIFTPLSAISFMVFTLLYAPCAAAIAAVKRETNSAKWAWFTVLYTTVIAWIMAVLVYQIGKMLGFS
ncbi:ferrous iron transport protein B [Clostridium rectalis]|uniref:ferrous iron transport protein B n=1 Tax=Clostridium rectalis TaxID=2040295 RepID=UPI000F6309D7|nr:ferrous iron transport protein B [Clostridium rectalis]